MSGLNFTVNLKLTEEQLQEIVDQHSLLDSVDELKEHLGNFSTELSSKAGLDAILDALDYFNY